MDFVKLNDNEAASLLDSVSDGEMAKIFDAERLAFYRKPLPFYKRGFLIVAEHTLSDPALLLSYIQTEHTLVYLDGSAKPFETLSHKSPPALTCDNIIDYLEFYCHFVIQSPNNVLLLKNSNDMPFYGDYYIDFHFDKHNYGSESIIIHQKTGDSGFIIDAPFIFDGKIDQGSAYISPDGLITVKKTPPQ